MVKKRKKLVSYDSLKEDFNQKLKKLQEECPHRRKVYVEKSQSVIPFHPGRIVKICVRCRKVIE
jgi:phenylalanyl-tRNA synthetase beta subunit